MKRSYLVQRLQKPYKGNNSLLGKDNPFAFGGGYKNGGLSDDAMGLLRGIFRFDYMGSAEFEWGAVPKALQTIAKDAPHLIATSFSIPLSDVATDFRDKRPMSVGKAHIYVLCREGHAAEVEQRIRSWASEGYNRELKETTRLSSALRPFHEWDGEVAGWLELDNGFMFFTDCDMWAQTARLFGVEVEGVVGSAA